VEGLTTHRWGRFGRIFARSRKTVLIWVLVLLFLGTAVRLVASAYAGVNRTPVSCEAVNIGISLAKTGSYADAYGAGVGPTAHCAPLQPLFLSAFFDLFGVNARAHFAINTAASIASALAFALLPALALACELPVFCGVLGGLAGALLPFNFYYQVRGNFDQPFTAAAFVALCILFCQTRRKARFTKWRGAALGVAAGLGCLLSPVMVPVMVAWVIIMVVEHRRQLGRMVIFSALAAVCFLATVSPWAIRNYEVLGALIWTRSDFWLEMNASNNNLMTANEEINLSLPDYALFSPYTGDIQRAKEKRLGELAYMQTKKQQFLGWLQNHKQRFLTLTAQRFRLFWFPKMERRIQTILEAALTILSISGLVLLFRARAPSAWIFGVLVVLYPAAYYLIMVSPRFRLPLEPFLFLLSGYCVFQIALALEHRRGSTRQRILSSPTLYSEP
jgi:hypothetical protein